MKRFKYIFLSVAFCVNSAALAQKITKVVDKEASFIAIEAESKTAGYENITLILEDDSPAYFCETLRADLKSFRKWYITAKDNHVTDFEKRLQKQYRIDHLLFDFDGHSYTTKSMFVHPTFVVDEVGEFFLRIKGSFNGGIGTDYYSTTKGLSFDGKQASVYSGETKLMKKVSFDYYINLSTDDMIPWLEDLDTKSRELIEEKKEIKKAERKKAMLFK